MPRTCPSGNLLRPKVKNDGITVKIEKMCFFGSEMAILAPFCCVRLRAYISPTPPYITSKALNLPQHTRRPHTSTSTRLNCVKAPPETKQGQKMTKKRKNRPFLTPPKKKSSIGFSTFWACSAWIWPKSFRIHLEGLKGHLSTQEWRISGYNCGLWGSRHFWNLKNGRFG